MLNFPSRVGPVVLVLEESSQVVGAGLMFNARVSCWRRLYSALAPTGILILWALYHCSKVVVSTLNPENAFSLDGAIFGLFHTFQSWATFNARNSAHRPNPEL